MKEISDELWERIEPLLSPFKRQKSGGSQALPFRNILNGILYVLITGCQWNMIPKEYGSKSTIHEHFQKWVANKVFDQIFQLLLEEYDSLKGINWEWQSSDGSLLQAPVHAGHSAFEGLGANPTDRGRCGSKIHLLVDGDGMPLGVEIAGAHVHDSRLVSSTIEAIAIERPETTEESPQHLCLDKAYDCERVELEVLAHNYQPHIRLLGEEKLDNTDKTKKKHPARRYVVERTFAWLKGFRCLRTRYFCFGINYLAMVKLACAIILI